MHPVVALLCAGLLSAVAWSREYEVTVAAPDSGCSVGIVSVPVPDDFPQTGMMENAKGQIAIQRNGVDTAVFVVRDLQPGETRVFTVRAAKEIPEAKAELENGRIRLSVGGKSVLTYQGQEMELPRSDIKAIFKRGGYLHPVLSPSGKAVTDDYPPNHIHHHGIWFPWTKTAFEGHEVDFWNMGQGLGKVEFVKFGANWSGPVQAGFTAHHRFVDLTSGQPKPVLEEIWTVNTYSIPNSDPADYFIFDLVSTQTCSTASALQLPKYYYGGLGFRGNWAWNSENNCFWLTSNGETDRVKGNETRGNWCHVGGKVDGALTGIAMLCHPDNFRAPQPMRLHPKEPFFCFAPSQLGDWSIEPGKPYVSRYRFIVKDGPPDKAGLDALWQAYAHPPKVTIVSR